MEHKDKAAAIKFIRPMAEFKLDDNELFWLDANQIEPTQKEIEAGFIAYQKLQKAEAEANASAKSALLAKLGITQDEAKLLLS